MRLEGLTQAQCDMLDKMWGKDTSEELYHFFLTLNEEEYNMALTLYHLIQQETDEESVEEGTADAVQMLKSIGVKV